MRAVVALGLAGLALAGCASSRPDMGGTAPLPIPATGFTIRYETGPCFGACPVYAVTVRPDGSGVFEGKRFTAVTGTRDFRLSPAEYDAFAARLARYRPESGEVRYAPGEPTCAHAATDLPSVDIRWTRAIGDSQGLYYYFGCNMDANQDMAEAIGNAPDELPIKALIGDRP